MAEFSLHAADLLAKRLLTNDSITRPGFPLRAHLFRTLPDSQGAGGTQLTGNNYSFKNVVFGRASGGATSNVYDVKWTAPTPDDENDTSKDWLPVVCLKVMDTGGNVIGFQNFPDNPIVLKGGHTLMIRSGALVVSFESEPDDDDDD